MSLFDVSDQVKFTKPPHGDWLWFNEAMSVRLIDQSSGSTSYENAITERTVATLTAPANSLSNGGALRFLAVGSVVSDSTGVTPTATWRVKGSVSGSTSTLFATSAISLSTSTGERDWGVSAVLYGQQPSVQHSFCHLTLSTPGSGTLLPTTFEAVGRSTSGLDESLQVSMSVTCQFDTASTDISMTRHFALLEAMGG